MPLLALTPFALGALLALHATLNNPYAVLTRFGGVALVVIDADGAVTAATAPRRVNGSRLRRL